MQERGYTVFANLNLSGPLGELQATADSHHHHNQPVFIQTVLLTQG
jgi:hypothetical protein